MKHIIFFFLVLFPALVYSQTQTIRGKIIEKATQMPVPGANVVLINSDPLVGVVSDLDGNFKIENVPVGRQGVRISYVGYNEMVINNLMLTSGKEIVLTIELEDIVTLEDKVVVSANREKEKPNNEMALVSARQFSIEETQRFAGSRNDVARMAQNFAGVQGADDSRNDIVIRGNSPMGVLYRLEGVDIPNPNHFAVPGTTGGPVSMLNNNVLSNSDFMTGAFPSEYGNAMSGVFDLRLRNGNNEQREFTGQFGFNGAELMAEGPFKKGKQASYLVSYRYSTLELFKLLGIEFGSASVPQYQDLSFKANFPNKKGSISVFGLGGISYVDLLNKDLDTSNNLFAEEGEDLRFRSTVGVAGISNTYFINPTTFIKTTFAVTAHDLRVILDSISTVDAQPFAFYRNNSLQGKQSLNSYINKKFSSKHVLKAGFYADRMFFQLSDSVYEGGLNQFVVLSDYSGSVYLLQPYVNWLYRPTNEISINTGLHYQHFTFNNSIAVEPRLGIKWQVSPASAFSMGYGLHSQLPPTEIFFDKIRLSDGSLVNVNTGIGFTKAHHVILGYDRRLAENIRLKAEAYYQSIFNVPVDVNSNAFSMLNQGANFRMSFPDTMANKGTGTNYGIELTLEKFLSQGLYFLVTASAYNSSYKGSDGIEHHTAFNGNYTFNALAGKEFLLGKKDENGKRNSKNVLTTDVKVMLNGGQRYTPILLNESRLAGEEIRDWTNAYSGKYPDYFRIDFKAGYKHNGKKITQEWSVDIQNIINHKNIFMQKFNATTGEISTSYQTGFLPVMQYRIEF